ncbi:MAG: hypothetical protein AAFY88_24020, partial [Acidobacteriota bacterium]
VTVDVPETGYGDEAAYDMEASAFLAAARRFQTAELVHVVKVISDGPEAPIASITRERVTGFIAAALPTIRALHEALAPIADELCGLSEPPAHEAALLERWHFTTSDRRALRRELIRGRTLGVDPDASLFEDARRGRDVVNALRQHLDRRAAEGRA